MRLYCLKINAKLSFEYEQRCIADVIPQLADYALDAGRKIMVDGETVGAIIADCKFMGDKNNIDSPASERAAYRAMLRQCEQALAIGPVEVIEDPDAEMINNFNWVGSRHHY